MKILLLLVVCFYIEAAVVKFPKNGQQKYIVYPGLDVDNGAIAGWMNGYSSPWNVFFGNQPYVVGWVGAEDSYYDDDDYEDSEYETGVVTPEIPHDEVTQDRG